MLLRSVLTKTVRDARRGLVGWSLGLAGLVLLTCSIYPSLKDNADLQKAVESYPEELKAFIGGTLELTTGPGYLEAELFSLLVPLVLLVYAIGAGARAIAGEEEAGTLDLLLANPLPRARVLLEKLGAIVVLLAALAVVLLATLVLSSTLFGLDVGVSRLAAAVLVAWLLGVLHAALALAVGAARGSRSRALAVAAAVAVASYLLYGLGGLVDALEPVRPLSPWDWYAGGDPLHDGLDLGRAALLAGATVLLAAAAVPAFRRRDLSV